MKRKIEERKPVFEITPLPPNSYEKQTVWNTESGKAPAERKCKVQDCQNTTTRDPALCEQHFFGMVGRVRGVLVKDKAKENGASNNGHK